MISIRPIISRVSRGTSKGGTNEARKECGRGIARALLHENAAPQESAYVHDVSIGKPEPGDKTAYPRLARNRDCWPRFVHAFALLYIALKMQHADFRDSGVPYLTAFLYGFFISLLLVVHPHRAYFPVVYI